MSTDTPNPERPNFDSGLTDEEAAAVVAGARQTPERVTLSDEEQGNAYQHFSYSMINDDAEEMYLGKCYLEADVERILAAREQALREEIAGEIETARDDMCRVTRTDPRHTIARVYDEAARIAQGETQ